jgi:molecular chaperone GrpE
MNSDTDKAPGAPDPELEDAIGGEPTASEEAASNESAELDPWEQLEADVTKWKELALRTAADLENYRKRAAREREDAMRYANQRLLEELLPVIDNFEMGMTAASQDQSSMIYIGMDMVRRQLADFLASQGVEEIVAVGQPFDPNLHDAVSEEESADHPDGQVLRVHRRGFRLRDRLLRPASVVVSKTPTKEG